MIITPANEPMLGDVMREVVVSPDSWEELETCPVCGTDDCLQDLAAVEAASAGAVVAFCADCEHLFKRRRPTTDWLERYYADDWDAQGRQAIRGETRTRTKILDFCREHLPDGARVLDMGAGFGKDILAFKMAGHDAYALEASQHRAEYISDVLGIPCVSAPFETAELPERLDLVFSNHVLEHITEPADVLARASRELHEGALFYVALPNGMAFEHAVQFLHYAPHQSGFSMRSLTRLLTQYGFEIVKSRATRELKVLARKKAGGAPGAADGADGLPSSRAAAEEWVASAFGRRPGRQTLLWWRPASRPDHCYEGTVVRGGELIYKTLLRARRLQTRLPSRVAPVVRRALPPYVYKKQVRMFHVDASGDFSLPVRVRYPQDDPPIWVK